VIVGVFITGCAIESHSTINTEKAEVSVTRSAFNKQVQMAVGQFANRSSYHNGIFSDGVDKLGSQAETILITFLHQAGGYMILDRNNMKAIERESNFSKTTQNITGARYVITGDIVEFGRKTIGDHQLWGILGHGKKQVAYANVNLNIVDVQTSAVVYSSTGAGEYVLSSRDVLGFGSNAGYDSTLNGKVLSLAIREAVNNMTRDIDKGLWIPE
jgi:curli biogenesis system outer membrane secretion channel CsgG